ncbi:H-SHIPPO_1 [Hexamita inflata]|uniref:H-SHIPPO 1 n=1 Tax=Hexamita inflata TaxID=28002 RepID=A0AA86UBC7_9EUKA|nr:H-SHIPPO 1 [Hexamita inflata]CAI9948879.1 H-SHIPPO 1 [Hexamita inflata]CAI9951016.1 H-SHIPPO 1 [Hexamita inflata]CAI9958322.1 H-SHIPPO 1 [Hexamita inflata]
MQFEDVDKFPGPGAYRPEDSKVAKLNQGSFTMQSRRVPKPNKDAAPSPNAYAIDKADRLRFPSTSEFTNGFRKNTGKKPMSEQAMKPSPAQYNPVDPSLKSVEFSFSYRTKEKLITNVCGPTTYKTEDYKSVGKTAPQISMSSRHKLPDLKDKTPAANAYDISATKDKGRVFTMRARTVNKTKNTNPSPNQYQVPPHQSTSKNLTMHNGRYKARVHTLTE